MAKLAIKISQDGARVSRKHEGGFEEAPKAEIAILLQLGFVLRQSHVRAEMENYSLEVARSNL